VQYNSCASSAQRVFRDVAQLQIQLSELVNKWRSPASSLETQGQDNVSEVYKGTLYEEYDKLTSPVMMSQRRGGPERPSWCLCHSPLS